MDDHELLYLLLTKGFFRGSYRDVFWGIQEDVELSEVVGEEARDAILARLERWDEANQ